MALLRWFVIWGAHKPPGRHGPLHAGHPRLGATLGKKDVGGPDKPGHDGKRSGRDQ